MEDNISDQTSRLIYTISIPIKIAFNNKYQMNLQPPIQYTQANCHFLIRFQASKILFRIQNHKLKRLSTLILTNDQIKQSKITTSELYRAIYKQYIHDKKKQMIVCQNGTILLSFNYPHAGLKSLKFNCEEVSTDQVQMDIQKIEQRIRENLMKNCLYMEKYTADIQKAFLNRIEEAIEMLGNKCMQLIKVLDKSFEEKMRQMSYFIESNKDEYQKNFKSFAIQSVKNIFQDNLKYFEEFHFIKTSLEQNISILSHNILEQAKRTRELEMEIDENKEELLEKIREINIRHESLERQFTEKLVDLKCDLIRLDIGKPTYVRSNQVSFFNLEEQEPYPNHFIENCIQTFEETKNIKTKEAQETKYTKNESKNMSRQLTNISRIY